MTRNDRTWAVMSERHCIRVEELHMLVDDVRCVRSGRDRDLVKKCLKGGTLDEVAKEFGLSSRRVGQIFNKFLRALRIRIESVLQHVDAPSMGGTLSAYSDCDLSEYVERYKDDSLVSTMYGFCTAGASQDAYWLRDYLTAEQFAVCCEKCYECRAKAGYACPQYKKLCAKIYGEDKAKEFFD